MIEEPQMEDSGERRTFASGAVRDRGGFKPRPDLISPHANLREGAWVGKGAEKYGARNYEKGIPISECIASLVRHLEAYKLGLQDEDHMAAIRTNAGFILHYEEEIKAGRMNPEIDDMPKYARKARVIRYEDMDDVTRTFVDKARELYLHFYDNCATGPTSEQLEGLTPEQREYVLEGDDESLCRCSQCVAERYGDSCHPPECLPAPPKRTVYIAGPMRGYPFFNFPAFDGARDLGKSLGWNVISPADLDREQGLDPFTDPAEINEVGLNPDGPTLRDFAVRDLGELLGLSAEDGDAIAMLPDWRHSKGASMEHAVSVFLGLRILDARTFRDLEG